jgi:septum formation protein
LSDSIILASASPRRKELLRLIYANSDFIIIPSGMEEPPPTPGQDPAAYAEALAAGKARDVAGRSRAALIIGSDTIVVHDGDVLGKPADAQEAREMLARLSNSWHEVITAVCLIKSGAKSEETGRKTFHVRTRVKFARLSEQEINTYVESGNPYDRAGSYGIQDNAGALFVESVEGDYYTIVGFPLQRFYQEMKDFAPDALPARFRS